MERLPKLIMTLALPFILSACTVDAETANGEIYTKADIKPVKLFTVQKSEINETLFFPAKVAAVRQVDLTFEVDGKIDVLNLPEGKKFKKGALLASLKSGTFDRRVRQATLNYEEAKTELNRIKKVDRQGYASKQSLTKAQTAYQLAMVELENAKADLSNSKLYAPFDGTVSKRLSEENMFVSRGNKIAELQDLTKVYFSIDVSERLISEIKGQKVISAKAKLSDVKQTEYQVVYAEHEASTNPVTQTYKVYFGMPFPKDGNINLGSHASLFVTLESNNNNSLLIPLSAVLSYPDNQHYVWLFSPISQTAIKVNVTLGGIEGDSVNILQGLSEGDQVVIAGAKRITSAQRLKPYKGE